MQNRPSKKADRQRLKDCLDRLSRHQGITPSSTFISHYPNHHGEAVDAKNFDGTLADAIDEHVEQVTDPGYVNELEQYITLQPAAHIKKYHTPEKRLADNLRTLAKNNNIQENNIDIGITPNLDNPNATPSNAANHIADSLERLNANKLKRLLP